MTMFRKAERKRVALKIAITGPSGSGKAQPLDSVVMTPKGPVAMRDVVPGSTVLGADGCWHSVTAVYPQGMKDVYKVTMTDNSSTLCCAEHLWLTQSPLDRAAARKGTVKPLSFIMETIHDKHGKFNHYIPMTKPVDFLESEVLPIDPYTFGVLLGDGGFTQASVTLSNPEPQIQEAVRSALPSGLELRPIVDNNRDFAIRRVSQKVEHRILNALRSLGLAGKKSTEKFIPACYLYSKADARLAVLQGLLDTDGYTNGHTLEYSTSSLRLSEDVQFLVESLGGRVSISSRIPGYHHKGEKREGAINYRVQVMLPPRIAPFRLSRKADCYIPKTKYHPSRAILSVEPAGQAECQCIAVDSPDNLYLTDHFIVTHNTYSALKLAAGMGSKIAVLDTENGSASLYADVAEYDAVEIAAPYTIAKYLDVIHAAEREGYEVLIIDSLSHAWAGDGGLLDQKSAKDARSGGNNFTNWAEISKQQETLKSALLHSSMHIVVTMRSKQEYVQEEDERGKKVIRKVGMAPIQRDGIEYEFTTVFDLDMGHFAQTAKDRTGLFDGAIERISEKHGNALMEWLAGGKALSIVDGGAIGQAAEQSENTAGVQGGAEDADIEAQRKAQAKERDKNALANFTAQARQMGYMGEILPLARNLCRMERPNALALETALQYSARDWNIAMDSLEPTAPANTLDMNANVPTAASIATMGAMAR